MLIRCRGYNSGIKEYLEEGKKADRELSRDQLDDRIILEGNLDVVDKVYKSLPDKGQERYLSFTLAFKEDDIKVEVMKQITKEFRGFLMKAYSDDEYCFYAEAHMPKLKQVADKKTGAMIDRKPHIHIVIPRKNLLSGNEMNPSGIYEDNEKYFEAFQEFINKKYHLESPRNNMRITPTGYADVLSRYKGDDFRAKNKKVKLQILEKVCSQDIRTRKGFYDLVSSYGETRIRNAGKSSEYIAVKLSGDQKFTNLKESIFSDDFIVDRKIIKPPLDDHVISSRLDQWITRASEIKYIDKIVTPKLRQKYYASDQDFKDEILDGVINKFYGQHRGKYEFNNSRTTANKRSPVKAQIRSPSSITDSLQNLSDGDVASTRQGQRNKVLLSGDARLHMDNVQTHGNSGLRRPLRGGGGGRGQQRRQRQQLSSTPNRERSTGRIQSRVGARRKHAGLRLTPYPCFPRIKNKIPTLADIQKRSDILFKDDVIAPPKIISLIPSNFTITPAKSSVSSWLLRRATSDLHERFSPYHLLKMINADFYEIKKEVMSDSRFTYDEKSQFLSILNFEKLKRKESVLNKSEDYIMGSKDIREMLEKNRKTSAGFTISAPEPEKPQKASSRFAKVIDRIINPTDYNYSKVADESRKSVEGKLDASNLYTKRTRKGHVHYLDKSNDKTLFVDTGKLLTMRKNGISKDSIGIALELAQGRFGSTLNIKGSKEFKDMVVDVVAERGLDIHFTDKKMNEALAQRKLELSQTKEAKPSTPDSAFTIEGADIPKYQSNTSNQEKSPNQSEMPTVEKVKAQLANLDVRPSMLSPEQLWRENGAPVEHTYEARAVTNAEIIEARTGVKLDPATLVQEARSARVVDVRPAPAAAAPVSAETWEKVKEVKAELANLALRPAMLNDGQVQREAYIDGSRMYEARAVTNAEIIEARTGVKLDPATLVQEARSARIIPTAAQPSMLDKVMEAARQRDPAKKSIETPDVPKTAVPRTAIPSVSKSEEHKPQLSELVGKIVKHGSAPYLNQEGNSTSYYVTLKDKDGNEQTQWGVGLKDALKGFKRGNEISLEWKSSEPVQIKTRDENGKSAVLDVTRNVWEAKRLDGPQPKQSSAATKGFRTIDVSNDAPDMA